MLRIRTVVAALALALGLLTASTSFAEMRLHGSSTVSKVVVDPNKAQIERAVGETLSVITNGSGNGLKDLIGGKADVAMISAPLAIEATILNTLEPGSLDASTLQAFPAGSTMLRCIVNPANPVGALTEAQARGIFTGEVTNWAQVGGADQPIVVVVERPLNGTRAFLQDSLLQGAAFSSQARVAHALPQVTQMVAQMPNAVGYGNGANSGAGTVKIVSGYAAAQPMALITIGAPTPAQRRLITAIGEVAVAAE